VVATDADPAGQQAAHRAYWRLTARGGDPRHLLMPTGTDPAGMLHTDGPAALRTALAAAGSLAGTLIDARIEPYADRLDTVEGRVLATRRAAAVIGALPPTSWAEHLTAVVTRTGIAPDTALSEVLDAGQAWANNPRDIAKRHLAERPPATPHRAGQNGPPPTLPVTAAQRWAALADRLHPQLRTRATISSVSSGVSRLGCFWR